MKVHPPYHSSFIWNRILVTLMMMTIENGEAFKAKRFDSRNLVIFMVTAFGWTWLFNALFVLEALQMPAGVVHPILTSQPYCLLLESFL